MRPAVIILRSVIAIAIIAAIVGQLIVSVAFWQANGVQHLGISVWNFFSFFTIQSNVLTIVAFAVGAVFLLRTRGVEPPRWTTFRACVATYMIVTGIVYNLLLRNIPLGGISDVWTNETLHVVIPLVMLADVLFAPRRRALGWSTVVIAAIFPVVWAVYTLIRANFIIGPATGNPWWYPYPFLDPHLTPGGYLGVAGYIVGITIAIIGVASFAVWAGRRRSRTRDDKAAVGTAR